MASIIYIKAFHGVDYLGQAMQITMTDLVFLHLIMKMSRPARLTTVKIEKKFSISIVKNTTFYDYVWSTYIPF